MSTWAELVEPSTRALVDDSDEDNSENQSVEGLEENLENQSVEGLTRTELIWKEEENATDISLLIIAHDTLSTLFARKFVHEEHHSMIAEVREFKEKESMLNKSASSTSLSLTSALSVTTSPIYRINKSSCICLCKKNDINNANKFRNAILPFLEKSAQIVIVSALKASSYIYDKLVSDISAPFIRCLHSSSYKSHCEESYLEQPNIVTGIPAAVLSWCEVFQTPGILYCVFSDTSELNSISAEPFVKIFSSLPCNVFDPSKVLFQKRSYGPESTNLYL